jgi:DNA-binding Xre family transcriptional regulator
MLNYDTMPCKTQGAGDGCPSARFPLSPSCFFFLPFRWFLSYDTSTKYVNRVMLYYHKKRRPMSKFISNITELMKKKKITIRELSARSGIAPATITKARKNEGISACRLSTLAPIGDALGVGTKRLYDEAEKTQETAPAK